MTQARFKGWLFFFSGLLLSVCCFLPIVKMVATKQSGAKETFYTKLMPSLPGFLILMLAVTCCIIALVGYKQGGGSVGRRYPVVHIIYRYKDRLHDQGCRYHHLRCVRNKCRYYRRQDLFVFVRLLSDDNRGMPCPVHGLYVRSFGRRLTTAS